MPPRMAAAAIRPGHNHRRPLPPPLGRSPSGGAGSCPMAPTPGDVPTCSSAFPCLITTWQYSASNFTPRSHNALPRSFEVRCLLRVVPDPSSVVRPSKLPWDNVHFRARRLPSSGCRRHLLAPCTFCGRYFRSGGLSRHQHFCFHRNTTPSQPPACGASLPRGRPSLVHPQSLPPAVQ
jgi:hypothetical protein